MNGELTKVSLWRRGIGMWKGRRNRDRHRERKRPEEVGNEVGRRRMSWWLSDMCVHQM